VRPNESPLGSVSVVVRRLRWTLCEPPDGLFTWNLETPVSRLHGTEQTSRSACNDCSGDNAGLGAGFCVDAQVSHQCSRNVGQHNRGGNVAAPMSCIGEQITEETISRHSSQHLSTRSTSSVGVRE